MLNRKRRRKIIFGGIFLLCCTFDDVADGTVGTVLEWMKAQPMLQTNVRRNHIGYARKNGIKIFGIFTSDIPTSSE